jgi:hypothetical protein
MTTFNRYKDALKAGAIASEFETAAKSLKISRRAQDKSLKGAAAYYNGLAEWANQADGYLSGLQEDLKEARPAGEIQAALDNMMVNAARFYPPLSISDDYKEDMRDQQATIDIIPDAPSSLRIGKLLLTSAYTNWEDSLLDISEYVQALEIVEQKRVDQTLSGKLGKYHHATGEDHGLMAPVNEYRQVCDSLFRRATVAHLRHDEMVEAQQDHDRKVLNVICAPC